MKLVYYGRIWSNFLELTDSRSHGENESAYVLRMHDVFEILTGKGSSPLSSIRGGEFDHPVWEECVWGLGMWDESRLTFGESCGYLLPYKGVEIERTGSVDGHDGWQWDGGYASVGGKDGVWDKEGAQEAINVIRQFCTIPDQPEAFHSGKIEVGDDFMGIYGRLCSNYLGFYECLGHIREECSKINNGNIPLESVEFRVLK